IAVLQAETNRLESRAARLRNKRVVSECGPQPISRCLVGNKTTPCRPETIRAPAPVPARLGTWVRPVVAARTRECGFRPENGYTPPSGRPEKMKDCPPIL